MKRPHIKYRMKNIQPSMGWIMVAIITNRFHCNPGWVGYLQLPSTKIWITNLKQNLASTLPEFLAMST